MSTIVDGVEYAQMPIPADLWRATGHSYAVDLIERGILYLTNANKQVNPCAIKPRRLSLLCIYVVAVCFDTNHKDT